MRNLHLYQFLATFTALLTVLSSGIHEAWTSVYIPQLLSGTDVIKITSNEGSWITLSMGFGGVMGCVIASFLADRFGRKKTILITSFPFLVSSIILAYSSSVLTFCVARIISGLASGIAIAVIPHYLGEIADPEIRGMLGTMVPLFNLIGFLFINIVGSYLTINMSSLISSAIPFVLLLTFVWMPESPYYLIMTGQFDAALKSLQKLNGDEDISEKFNKLKKTIKTQIKNKGKIRELFTKPCNKKALVIIFILVNGKQLTGIGPIDAYAQLIFQQIFDQVSPLVVTLGYYLTRFLVVILSSFLTDKIGRKPLLLISFSGSAVTLFLLAVYLYIKSYTSLDTTTYGFFPILCVEGFAIAYSFLTSIPLLMLGELFPMNVKCIASIFHEVNRYAISLIIIKYFQVMSDHFGMESAFLTFSIFCVVIVLLTYKFIFETKGKTLDEIQKHLEIH